MKNIETGMNRRNFLRNTGLARSRRCNRHRRPDGWSGQDARASALGLAPTKVEAAGLSATDIAVLQFALNLEYLEAEFYSYVVTGRGLVDNGIPVDGAVGDSGPTTGGTRVKFEHQGGEGPLRRVAEGLMRDEVNHVLLLRSFLGSEYTIASQRSGWTRWERSTISKCI